MAVAGCRRRRILLCRRAGHGLGWCYGSWKRQTGWTPFVGIQRRGNHCMAVLGDRRERPLLMRLSGRRLGGGKSTASVEPSPAVLAPIPPVLDGIVTPTGETASNLGPALADIPHKSLDIPTLLHGDGVVSEAGLEVLVIALAALLGGAGAQRLGDDDPIERAMYPHQLLQRAVLGRRPWTSPMGRRHDESVLLQVATRVSGDAGDGAEACRLAGGGGNAGQTLARALYREPRVKRREGDGCMGGQKASILHTQVAT